jgi:hypothetical protein
MYISCVASLGRGGAEATTTQELIRKMLNDLQVSEHNRAIHSGTLHRL